MNESKHVVAALRKIIGLKQKEFGDLIGKSLPTVQAIEYGKLRLTEAVAEEISRQTGAHVGWLLKNDPTLPAVNRIWTKYSKIDFERAQADLRSKIGDNPIDRVRVPMEAHQLFSGIASMGCQALKDGRWNLFAYKCEQALNQLVKEFGHDITNPPDKFRKLDNCGKFAEKATQASVKSFYSTLFRQVNNSGK
jgi:transcriptional regulator with XRE-family HTH domain